MKFKFKSAIITLIFLIGLFFGLTANKTPQQSEYYDNFDRFAKASIELISSADTSSREIELSKSEDLFLEDYTYMISAQKFKEKTDADIEYTSSKTLKISSPTDTIEIENDNNIIRLNSSTDALSQTPKINENLSTFPIKEIATQLGYTIIETPNEIHLHRPFGLKRLIVKSANNIDTLNAINHVSGYNDLHILQFANELDTELAYNYYQNSDNVEYVDPDIQIKLTNNDIETQGINDSFSYSTWGADTLGVENYSQYLLDKYSTLEEVVVGVIDTGIDTDHPWFKNRITSGGKNFYDNSNPDNYEDVLGHGTHVSGIITDLTTENVKILPLQVFDPKGNSTSIHTQLAIDYAINQKINGYSDIKVLNMSLGAPITIGNSSHNTLTECVENAYNAGILVVAAAGNESLNAENFCPANIEKAITVSALTNSSSSNTQVLNPASYTNYGAFIDLSAPGTNINSAYNNGTTTSLQGTSMAAPHVAGAIALMLSDTEQNYTLENVEDTLYSTAIDLGENGRDKYYGEGVVSLKYTNLETIEKVGFSITAPNHTEEFQLTLTSATPNAIIKYTTDGTIPSESNGTTYTAPITISSTTKISAFAYTLDDQKINSFSPITSYIYYFLEDIDNAYSVSVDGTITSYNGVLTDIKIPSQINGITVTTIGHSAFKNNSTITSVTLPSSVTYIDDYAFYGCQNLTSIQAPNVLIVGTYSCANTPITSLSSDNFPKLSIIYSYAFYNCQQIQEISLPSVSYVGSYAFYRSSSNFHKKAVLNIPNAQYILDDAFNGCTKITDANISSTIFIGSKAFYSTGLTSIDAPVCKYINNQAFAYSNALEFANLEEVLYIGDQAFQQTSSTSSLWSVMMPKVRTIGKYAFDGCEIIQVNSGNAIYLPEATHIGKYAFSKINVGKINLPNIISIGSYAFYSSNVSSIYLSESVTHIDNNAFQYISSSCTLHVYDSTAGQEYAETQNLTYNLYNPQGYFSYTKNNNEICITGYREDPTFLPLYVDGLPVTSIAVGALENCLTLEKINMQFLKHIGANAFKGCSNLEYILLPNVETIEASAFQGCVSLRRTELPSLTSLGDQCFYGCESLKSITLSKNLKSIGNQALGYDSSATAIIDFIIFGYDNTPAKTYAEENDLEFENCVQSLSDTIYQTYNNNGNTEIEIVKVSSINMLDIVIPEKIGNKIVSSLSAGAFANCNLITSITLPNTITSIPDQAFLACSKLQLINLENITFIGESAFEGCENLQKVYLPNIQSISYNAFDDCSNILVIGKNLSEFDNTSLCSDNIVYGYKNSTAEDCCSTTGAQFVAIDELEIKTNIPNAISLLEGESHTLEFEANGFEVKYQWFSTPDTIENGIAISGANAPTYTATLNSTMQKYYAQATSWDGELVTSNICSISTLTTYQIRIIIEYNDFQLLSGDSSFIEGSTPTIEIPTVTGYHLTRIFINETELSFPDVIKAISNGYTTDPLTDNLTIRLVYSPNTNTPYMVRHWKESLNNTGTLFVDRYYYCELEELQTGTTGKPTNPTIKNYEGFNTPIFTNANINANGNTIIDLLYTRQEFDLILHKNTGIASVTGAGSYKFESTVIISATLEDGYTWTGWQSADENTYPSNKSNSVEISIGLSNIELTATAKLKTYSITTYKEGLGEISTNPTESITHNETLTIKFTPDTSSGYYLSLVLINNTDRTSDVIDGTLTLTNVSSNILIEAKFELIDISISASAVNGTISPQGTIKVKYESSQLFKFEPNTGYTLSEIIINNVSLTNINLEEAQNNGYLLENIISEQSIEAIFTKKQVFVEVKTNNFGQVSVDSTQPIYYGDSRTYYFAPMSGYQVGQILVDGTQVPTANYYTLDNIQKDKTTISVIFTKIEYAVDASASYGGTISPSGRTYVKHNENIEFTITPLAGYVISNIKVNGTNIDISNIDITTTSSYTISNVTQQTSINVEFLITQIELTVNCGENGTITPSGKIILDYGSSQTFEITPYTGYGIKSIKLNNIEYGQDNTLELTNITQNYTINVIFEKIQNIAITFDYGNDDTTIINTEVLYGQSSTFTITPKDGYKIKEVKVNDEIVEIQDTITLYNITADTEIEVTYERQSFNIAIEIIGQGSYTCQDSLDRVYYGSNIEITLSPDLNYIIDKVIIDNQSANINNDKIVLNNINNNHSITVYFVEDPDTPINYTPIIIIAIITALGIVLAILFSRRQRRY